MGGKLWKLRYGAKGVSEARWRAAGRGMDWKGKGDGLKMGLTWTVFLKGTLTLILGGGYAGVYDFKTH